MPTTRRLFLVREDILPESIVKALRAKEMLLRGEAGTVNEAVARVNLSRSAYYKYRDSVFPLHTSVKEREITADITLEHRTGVLSGVLAAIASVGGNILTINQDPPVRGQARVRLSLDITGLSGDVEKVLEQIRRIEGVRAVSLQEDKNPEVITRLSGGRKGRR